MPGFCVNCGAPLQGAFCGKCGARSVSASTSQPVAPQSAPTTFPAGAEPFPGEGQGAFQAVQQASVPPVPPPQPVAQVPFQPAAQGSFQPVAQSYGAAQPTVAKGSVLGKVLLIVGGLLVLLFVIGIAGAVYGVYWAKHKVATFASEIKTATGDNVKPATGGNSCRLLSTSDVEQVLGVSIERSEEITESDTPGCAYYTNQEAVKKLQAMAAQQARKQADEVNSRPGPKPDNLPALLKDANQLEGIVKILGMSQGAENGRVFEFTVQRGFGEDSWSGMRLTEAAVPGFEEVRGVADHAMLGAFGHAFYFKKGDTMVYMNTMLVPDARSRGSALARKIIANL